ncbi:MAG: hypothetical protein AC479_04020 [miscellaneous Crenarchaeota group-6 archaeon AD8-1]|nr:MAG: hypothetical protein AC479_04020 [miscellaneous Crenarchaeota group-6 archaeon AD8-1]
MIYLKNKINIIITIIPAIAFTIISLPYWYGYFFLSDPFFPEIKYSHLLRVELYGTISLLFWFVTFFYYSKYKMQKNKKDNL